MVKRAASSADASKILSLHNAFWQDNRTPEHWKWEYEGHYPEKYVFTILEDKNRIVGTQGMLPINLNIGGKKHLSGKSENSLLDPKYRGGSFFTELYEFAMSLCKEKGMCCVWGFTNVGKILRDKLQFTIYENCIYDAISVLSFRSSLSVIQNAKWTKKRRIVFSILSLFGAMYSYICRSIIKTPKKKYAIEQKLRSIDDMEKLLNRLEKKHPNLIHIEQDEKYINWRLYTNPNLQYKTYFVYDNEMLVGYCYLNVRDDKIAHLTDFTFDDINSSICLLKKILYELVKEKIAYLSFMGNVKNQIIATTFKVLRRHGFLKRKSPMDFILKNISYEDEKSLLDIKNWHLSGLWTEGYDI